MSDYAARTALGTHSAYPRAYNPDLLQGIERADYRKALAQPARDSAFAAQAEGFDRWHCLEVSWLNAKGKPCFAQGSFSVPSASPRIVESKSVKLYLASLNQHRFENAHALESAVSQDIGKVCGSDVHFKLAGSEQGDAASPGKEAGALTNAQSIDAIDVACSQYQRDPNLLQQGAGNVEKEILTTQLLRSNCPVTGQPDWAELSICYSGRQLEAASLLQYVASFREHSGFHEHTLEQVYLDLAGLPGIDALATLARYTRRGGVAISAYRASPGFRNGLQDIALLRAAIQ